MDPIEESVNILQPAIDTLNQFAESAIANTPNLVGAILVFILGLALTDLLSKAVQKALRRAGRPENTVIVMSRLTKYALNIMVFFLALTVLLPNFTASSVLAGIGFGSVAVGFAFRDILQNFLAGILILLTEPFLIGDQIIMDNFEGTVDDIQIRATMLKTYDGRRVVIPNSDIYTHVVVVNTAFPQRRSQYDVGIGYRDNIDHAKSSILKALTKVSGISTQPAPDVIMLDLADSSVVMRVRWWTDSKRGDVVRVQDSVITAIKEALDLEGIDIPYPIQTTLVVNSESANKSDIPLPPQTSERKAS